MLAACIYFVCLLDACRQRLLEDRHTKELRKMVIMVEKVVCIDSVKGSGDTVREMRSLLESKIMDLPTMRQSVPSRWVELLDKSRIRLSPHHIIPLDLALEELGLDELGLTKEQALNALEFWDGLGHLKLHSGSAVSCVVTDVPWLIDLLRPLIHHDIVGSLRKACAGIEPLNHCDLAVAGSNCKGLAGREQQELLKMAGELQGYKIVRKELLPYLAYWCDLKTEKERHAALEILESCLLVTRYSIGCSLPVEWVVTCRIKQPKQSQAASIRLEDRVKGGPVLCCRADSVIPPGLFSTLQAVQILRLRQSAWPFIVPKADSTELHIVLTNQRHKISAWTSQQQHISASQDQEHRPCCLYLQADTLPLLTMLCCHLEDIVREMFPGFISTSSVQFHYKNLNAIYEWRVDSCSSEELDQTEEPEPQTASRWKKARGGMGCMLRHGLNMQRSAELIRVLETNDSDEEQPPSESMVSNIPLHQALHPLATASAARPFFFLSHSSDSHPSALAASAERVLGGVADLLEQVSGQDVLASTRGVAHQACCSGAQAVLVLLSPAYLASRLSLLELGMALEAHLGRGAPLLAVTVDAQVQTNHVTYYII